MTSTSKFMQRRFSRIQRAVKAGNVQPGSDVIRELAELSEKLNESRPVIRKIENVVARMTVVKADGNRMIIEVSANATFSNFYSFFAQEGKRRSTKRRVRTATRNEGLNGFEVYSMRPGLEVLARRWKALPGVVSVKIRIIRKRAYKKLINARPDELGMTKCPKLNLPTERFPLHGTFVAPAPVRQAAEVMA